MLLPGALALVLAAEVSVQPGSAHPGDVVLVTVTGTTGAPTGRLGGDELSFVPAAHAFEALVALKVDQKPGVLTLEVDGADQAGTLRLQGTFEVLKPAFRRRELTVSTRFTNPSKADQLHSARDQVAFVEAFDRDFERLTFSGNFDWPRRAEITAPFGDLRLLNGKKQSQHFGLDLDGNVGDPIYAANDGEVAMARDCFASGNTVLLHHGARLFTSYFHLSKFAVKQGDWVKRGQLLGLVGKTGRVTGPHLHFGVKVDGRWANPESLLALDFGLQQPTDRSTSPAASPETP
jgi:murein DD-endopeptidase MepM/ murein hydrolase activator NlpD